MAVMISLVCMLAWVLVVLWGVDQDADVGSKIYICQKMFVFIQISSSSLLSPITLQLLQ